MRTSFTISLFILVTLNFLFRFSDGVDYCQKVLCKPNRKHIACGNEGKISSSCANCSEILTLTPEIKANIVKKHNEYRNKLALGQVPNFPTASRMATMQWHDELAKMADLNVKTCTEKHDSCHNTFNFPFSGQNIATRTTRAESISMQQLQYNIYHGIDRWFKENEKYPRNSSLVYTNKNKKLGHFTVMITERNTHLGCAVILMKKKKTLFTCNYAWTNMRNERLYSSGNTVSNCKTGPNKDFPGLCSVNEKYE